LSHAGKKQARRGNIILKCRLSLRERAIAFAERKPTLPGDAMNPPAIDWQAALAQHDRWLRTVALARVREPQAVDEVMQEVALAAVKQSAPLADAGKVAPWLYRLAVLQALLYRRKCGRRRRLNDRYGEQVRNGYAEPPGSPDPLGWLIAQERRALVRRALSQIARRDAEILLLKYTEGWSYHQMAAHLGISHAAVEARLHRARARLRQELAALDVIEAA
jgi:RNA polymerase sigma factor (sigma-70 family)